MPPKNNFSAELKWLLSAKPYVPPAAPLVAYDPHAPASSTTVSQPSSSSVDPSSNNEPIPAPRHGITQTKPQASRSRTIDIHKLSSEQAGATEMARLRAAPGDNKPRLALAGLHSSEPHSASGSNASAESSMGRNSEASITPISERPTAHRQRLQAQGIESIDLTGGDGQPSPNKSRGKKRKSDEHEADLGQWKSPRSAKAIPASSPSTDYEGFANIDDMMTFVPESPPPPYSTTVPSRRIMRLEEEDHGMDAAVQLVQSSRKRKSLSRIPSETVAPARKLGRSTRSPSPLQGIQSTRTKTSKRRVQNAVLDSEDDEFEPFDGFDLDIMPGAISDTKDSIHIEPTRQSQIELPVRSPSKSREIPDHAQTKYNLSVTPEALQSPKRTCPPPKEVQHTSIPPLQPGHNPAAPQLSQDNKSRIRHAIEAFLDSEGCRMKRHIESAVATWAKAKDMYLKHAEAGTSTPAHQEAIKRANTQKKALEQLHSMKSQYEDLTMKRHELRKKIADDIDNCEFNAEDNQALETYAKSLDDIQMQMYSLLKDAGMEKYMDSSVNGTNEDFGSVVIKSTQVAPVSNLPRMADGRPSIPGSDHVPQTQYIRQTQISQQEVWTPSRRIRFAETHIVESTPPRLDWNNNSLSRSVPVSNARPFTGQKSCQVSEAHQSNGPSTLRVDQSPEKYAVESLVISDDDFGPDFDDDDVNSIRETMGAAPESIDIEDEFCDEDDDDVFHQFSNIENKPPGGYDWKGDRVENRGVHSARKVLKEASTNKVQQCKDPPSPKKPQLYAPGMNHPWSRDVRDTLLYRFRLRGFRPGQLDAINTTLAGEHCFVLMPTGGGKSLCYQLPSIIKSGKTRGVSIVVSPLLSLMEDQVAACKNRFGMQAFLINGETTAEVKDTIMNSLHERNPEDFVQVLYVTPEMLSKNQRMISEFQQLHRRNRLARVVIDEAHCVSQWGHDFRPDYKALGDVLRQFSGVPIIALTATATQLVRTDVMANLGIGGCQLFSQSFNRPNLSYSVLPKIKNIVPNIADLIRSEYPGKCGIIYCQSRKSCENVAKKLTSMGISAYHYHAGMEPTKRSEVQRKWQVNEYHVIVATIAFGMGIDKADVRFVIHHSLPKTLEGYYQETGRAGRDGKKSECYLYYHYGDCKVLKKMIDEGDGNLEQKQRQHDMLRNVIQFCENKSDCRRVQVLSYFSESFRKEDCRGTCDNCTSGATFEERDLSKYAQKAIELVSKVHESNVTVLQCVDAFRGAKNAKWKENDIGDVIGFGADLERGDVERVFNHLLESQALTETSKSNKMGFVTNYVHPGPRSREYASGTRLFSMQVRVTPHKKPPVQKESKKKVTNNRSEYPSTNVSSPIRPPQKRILKQYAYDEDKDEYYYAAAARGQTRVRYNDFVVPDNDSDDDYNEDSDFAPVREARPIPRRAKQKARSAPITVDETLSGLSTLQRDILLGDYMTGAKDMIKDIKFKKGLKFAPFPDTILREMGMDLPRNTEEMLAIPGINPEMVKLYGRKFLPLINNTREIFMATGSLPVPRHLLQRARVDEDGENEDDEERPADPNHRIEIDLCGESDGEGQMQAENESVVSMGDFEEDDDDDGLVHTSHHFNHQVNPEVEAFNRRFSQAEAAKPNSQHTAPSVARTPAPKASSSRPPFKKKNAYRKRSPGRFDKFAYGGVMKRGGSKGPGAKRSSGTGNTRKPPHNGAGNRRSGGGSSARGDGGGGSGWGGILAMPTN